MGRRGGVEAENPVFTVDKPGPDVVVIFALCAAELSLAWGAAGSSGVRKELKIRYQNYVYTFILHSHSVFLQRLYNINIDFVVRKKTEES